MHTSKRMTIAYLAMAAALLALFALNLFWGSIALSGGHRGGPAGPPHKRAGG